LPNFFNVSLRIEYLSKQPNHRLPCFPPPGLVQLPGQIGLSMLFPVIFQSAGGVAKTLPGGTRSERDGTGNANAGGCLIFCAWCRWGGAHLEQFFCLHGRFHWFFFLRWNKVLTSQCQ